MAKSKVVITFNSNPAIGTELELINSILPLITLTELFSTIRDGNFKSKVGVDNNESAFNYFQAFNSDYNGTNLYLTSLSNNQVTVEATQSNVVFTESINDTAGAVTTVITNEVEATPFNIDTVTYLEATTNPVCTHVKVQVNTNELATKVTSPLIINPNLVNPFFFEWVRGDQFDITAENALAQSDTFKAKSPQTLSASNVTLNIINSPNGATVNVLVDESGGLDLQYSMDDVTYQTSNSFTGIVDGNYTMYVKDQLGCKVSVPFEVETFTPDVSVTVPEFLLSKAMSIRFKRDIVWNNCSDYKNEENTLSCEYNTLLPYPTIQQFQTCDIITTQFKSNYETILANVIKEDLTKDALSIVKKSTNIAREEKLDSTYYAINDTQTGVYFTAGNTYDYTTGLPIGTYALNGSLPDFGIINNFVFLDGIGWFQIVDIIFNDSVNADVLVIDYVYTGLPTTIIASSIFNIENYEVYEFDIDFSQYNNEEIQVEILNNDSVFDSIRMLSEKIEVSERFEDTIEINYWNPTNTDVFYSTGIKNKIRLKYENFVAAIDPSIDKLNTDTNSILLNSTMYENNILTLSPTTVGIMRQVTQALLHKELYLDGVKYTISEPPETEPFGRTNLIVVTATLTKDGNVYNSEIEGGITDIQGNTTLVGLLKSDGKYIKLN